MLRSALALLHNPVAVFVARVNSAPHDNSRLFLAGAAALILAAGGWLAIEVRRAWSAEPDPRALRERGSVTNRQPPVDNHPLVPQLVEEIIRLNAQITQLRDAQTRPSEPDDAELAIWALAGLEACVAERQREKQDFLESERV